MIGVADYRGWARCLCGGEGKGQDEKYALQNSWRWGSERRRLYPARVSGQVRVRCVVLITLAKLEIASNHYISTIRHHEPLFPSPIALHEYFRRTLLLKSSSRKIQGCELSTKFCDQGNKTPASLASEPHSYAERTRTTRGSPKIRIPSKTPANLVRDGPSERSANEVSLQQR